MIVKVCGMCNSENLTDLIQLDVDWVGMIFYDGSSRHIEADETAAENLRLLKISDFGIKKVGVFVNATKDTILQKVKSYNLNYVQLHGQETPEDCQVLQQSNLSIIKAFALDEHFDFERLNEYAPYCDYFLFDTKGKLPGGNGVTFNWGLLDKYKLDVPFLLSGGIGLDQLTALKTFTHPQLIGIDLNSQFETSPGIKNIEKLKLFIDAFRSKTIQI